MANEVVSASWARVMSLRAAETAEGHRVGLMAVELTAEGSTDLAFSLDDLRTLVTEALAALAFHGDPIAREIGDHYFLPADEPADEPADGAAGSWRERPALL